MAVSRCRPHRTPTSEIAENNAAALQKLMKESMTVVATTTLVVLV